MDQLKMSTIIQVIKGIAFNCDKKGLIKGIAVDIREVREGYIFIPLPSDEESVENLVDTSLKKGAAAVILSNKLAADIPQIIVTNEKWAYRKLYKYYRSRFKIPVIGITGSAGKTSTKDMLSLMLSKKFEVCKTTASDNSLRDTVKTIFSMKSTNGAAVFEFGFAGYYNYISAMAGAARPSIAIITNISTAHRHVLGSKDKILEAKMEITNHFDNNSILIINNDDEYLSTIKDKPYRIVRVSIKGSGDYNAFDIVNNGEKGIEFKSIVNGKLHTFKLKVPGAHFVYNALFCIAVGNLLNIDIDVIKKALYEFKPYGRRMQIISLPDNIRIINDCYNANLLSMQAAVDTLKTFTGRRIAVLGDIFKQGRFSEETHRQLGRYIKDQCDILITVGPDSKFIREEAAPYVEAHHFDTKEEACIYLEHLISRNDAVLIKGSRGMKMEDITKFLYSKLKVV